MSTNRQSDAASPWRAPALLAVLVILFLLALFVLASGITVLQVAMFALASAAAAWLFFTGRWAS